MQIWKFPFSSLFMSRRVMRQMASYLYPFCEKISIRCLKMLLIVFNIHRLSYMIV